MKMQTITFRLDASKRKSLDAIADGIERNRSYVLGEAVDNYLETHRWQVEHVKAGLRQADTGRFASDAEVAAAFAKFRK